MASRFEIVLHGEDAIGLQAAGEEALDEIDRIEDQISIYRSDSAIHHVNACAHLHPVKLEPTLFAFLQKCKMLSQQTESAFDISLAPLIRCWGFVGGSGAFPDFETIETARRLVGFSNIRLDKNAFTIEFGAEGVMLDLGSIGKGFALDCARESLRENGIQSALLHGGTSTIATLGTPPHQDSWKIAITQPDEKNGESQSVGIAHLAGNALSVSAIWGKSFQKGNRHYGHVIDGRSGEPALGADQSAVILPSATDADAVSTALLVDGKRAIKWLDRHFPQSAFYIFKKGKRPITKGVELI